MHASEWHLCASEAHSSEEQKQKEEINKQTIEYQTGIEVQLLSQCQKGTTFTSLCKDQLFCLHTNLCHRSY